MEFLFYNCFSRMAAAAQNEINCFIYITFSEYGSVPIGAPGQKLWTIQHILEAFVEELKPYNFSSFWDQICLEREKLHKYIGTNYETVSFVLETFTGIIAIFSNIYRHIGCPIKTFLCPIKRFPKSVYFVELYLNQEGFGGRRIFNYGTREHSNCRYLVRVRFPPPLPPPPNLYRSRFF